MPPKGRGGTKSLNRSDVQDKVKEIKQRQQNWLKQRDDLLQSRSVNQEVDHKPMSENHVKTSAKSVPNVSKAVGFVEGSTSQTTTKQKGFRAWMKATEDGATPKHELGKSYVVCNHGDVSSSAPVEKPLSPEQFDDVAERIANRVKHQLQINNSYDANKYKKESYAAEVTTDANHYGYHDDEEEAEDLSSQLNSHVCPQCSQLMVDKHEPMLIIPCGHNTCRQCSEEDDLCPICSCEIKSMTCNIMLKQVINDFKREHRKVRSSRSNSRSTTAGSYQNETDYSEELKSLMMRLEILESECDNIRDVMRVIQQDVVSEKQQIHRIEEEEDRVKREMQNLNKKLDSLAKHKDAFRDTIDNLEERHNREADKLNMVKETIRELNRGVEKIQLRCSKT